MDNSEITFKTIVIGAPYVGKTALLRKYMKNQFSHEYNVTVGVEFNSKIIQVNEKTAVKLQIWDTAGQETFKAVVRSFYKGAAAAFLVYQIDKEESFEALKGWVKQVKENTHEEALLFLVGAKLDLDDKRKVSKETAEAYLKEIGGVYFVQASAKSGQNVKELFQRAAKILHKKYTVSGSFRNLVRPVLSSGFTPGIGVDDRMQRTTSISLTKMANKKKDKTCC